MAKSGTSTSGKSSSTIVHKSTDGDDAENRTKKKLKKKKTSTTSDRVLGTRNEVSAKTGSSQPTKRKSEQTVTTNQSAGPKEDDSGCSQPKKPSPKHTVSVYFALFITPSQDTGKII